MVWTDDAENYVVANIGGLEYKDIAANLGTSVNAVCAKIDRMKRQGKIPAKDGRSGSKVTSKSKRQYDVQACDIFGLTKIVNAHAEEAAQKAGDLIKLEDQADHGCCFVVGDPLKSMAVYCPNPSIPGSAYCCEHHVRVWQPIKITERQNKEALVHA